MARSSLDDAQWASLLLCMHALPGVWKKDDPALRRFVEAALWVGRTGAPWRDLPAELGLWTSVYRRWRRCCANRHATSPCLRGWWEAVFEQRRPSVPADGLVMADSTTCKAHYSATGAACSTAGAEDLGRSRGGLCTKLQACAAKPRRGLRGTARGACCGCLPVPASTPTCVMPARCWPTCSHVMRFSTAATCQPGSGATSQPRRKRLAFRRARVRRAASCQAPPDRERLLPLEGPCPPRAAA